MGYRRQQPGSFLDALDDAIGAAGRRRVADAMDCDRSLVSKWLNPHPHEGEPRLSALQLTLLARLFPREIGDRVAHWLAATVGGVYMPPPGGAALAGSLADCVREFADVLRVDAETRSDLVVTPREARDQIAEIDDCLQALTARRARLAEVARGGRPVGVAEAG